MIRRIALVLAVIPLAVALAIGCRESREAAQLDALSNLLPLE